MAISEPVVTFFDGEETITVTCENNRVVVESDREDLTTMDWDRRADWMGERREQTCLQNSYMVYQADTSGEAENLFAWVIEQIRGDGWVMQ